MNERQKKVLSSQLKSEEDVLKDLKKVYKKALDDVNANIAQLLGRGDADLQHVIYQVDYQKALKKQITTILDDMNTKQFKTISEYLSKSYEDGFMGVVYDLHGQGIPLIMPINQEDAVRAIQHDTKLSKPLYDRLGEDAHLLNRRIQSNISRGISQNSPYAEIARNIAAGMVGDYSSLKGGALGKAMQIARTEAHRITSEGRFDAQTKAKDMGADIIKQWDAALDKRTRPTHARLDGQLREVDEPFEVNGHKALYPGGFGVAAEDINCRCAVLQRAKWALDEDELNTLKERAEYFGLDKAESFEDFKSKYIKAGEVVEPKPVKVNLAIENFPEAFRDTAGRKKKTQQFVDYVNGIEGSDPDVVKLYENMGKMDNIGSAGIPLKVSYTADGHAVSGSVSRRTNDWAEVTVKIPKLEGEDISGQVQTTAHETAHLMDLFNRENTGYNNWASNTNNKIKEIFAKGDASISDEIQTMFNDFHKQSDDIYSSVSKEYKTIRDTLTNEFHGGKIGFTEYKKAYNASWKEENLKRDYLVRNAGKGVDGLEDIYDALSGGAYRDKGIVKYGHGSKYYRDADNRPQETFANYCSLSLTRPELISILEKDKPDLVYAYRELVKEINGKVGN